MRKHRETSLVLGALLALGCGGNAVDLGHGLDGHGWTDAPEEEASASTPQVIYDSDEYLLGFALEGPTLYALVETVETVELIVCPLDRCRSQRTTLFSGPKRDIGIRRVTLVQAGDRIFWLSSEKGLVACAKTGCSDLQRVSSAWGEGCLAADGDALYWIDDAKTLQRLDTATATDAREKIRGLPEEIVGPAHLAVSDDYVFITDAAAQLPKIVRVHKDGTRAPEQVVEDDGISGISVLGGSLYYPSKILSGRVVECPLDGCAGVATTLVRDQRWPSEVRVEGDQAFWLTDTRVSYHPLNSTLSSCRLPDCASVEVRVADFPLEANGTDDRGPGIALGAHSVVWREGRSPQPGSRLRRMPR